MDTVKVKRIAKKAAKHGFWFLSDAFFLALKAAGTILLIAVVAGVIYACFFLSYLRDNVITDLEINPADFAMSRSSEICHIDPYTGREIQDVIIQSTEFRQWVDFNQMPDHLIDAVIAIEDHRFYSHQGVDWYRTAGAFLNMFLGMRDTFGGSTITQQLIKNLTADDDATVARKLQEIFRALEYERQYSKEEILELYLNLVYFGHGCYGIGAAAHYYFDKEVTELTLPEAAAIVSITNNPSLYSPYVDRQANKERQETVLWSMNKRGYFENDAQYRQALNASLHFQRGVDDTAEQVVYTWFEEAVMRDAVEAMVTQLGYSEQIALRMLYTGGLKIISTMNPDMQAIVDEIYNNPENMPQVTGKGTSQQMQSSVIIADPYNGEIVALSGGVGRKTRNLLLNRATQTRRPPGSAIKPLSVYAPALDYGMLTPDTIYDDTNAELPGTLIYTGSYWLPQNSNRQLAGPVTVREALRLSVNTVAAIVLDQLTPATSFVFMRDMLGFNLEPEDRNYAALSIGQLTWGATVREMTAGYTMFPNGGYCMQLRTFSAIYDYNGDILLDNSVSGYTEAISDVTAYWITDMLVEAVTSGTGGSANLGAHMPTAGKTGTTTDNKDRWFVGYTPYYVAAVWTGFDTPAEMVVAGNINPAAQIWKMIMEPVHATLETRSFNKPAYVELPEITYPWEQDITQYTIRGVDVYGNVLFEYTEESVIGAEVMVEAPEVSDYNPVGQWYISIIMTADPNRNVILFTYRHEDDKGPSGSGNNNNDNDDFFSPTPTVSPTPTQTPTPTPTPDTPEPPPDTPEPPPDTPEPPPDTPEP